MDNWISARAIVVLLGSSTFPQLLLSGWKRRHPDAQDPRVLLKLAARGEMLQIAKVRARWAGATFMGSFLLAFFLEQEGLITIGLFGLAMLFSLAAFAISNEAGRAKYLAAINQASDFRRHFSKILWELELHRRQICSLSPATITKRAKAAQANVAWRVLALEGEHKLGNVADLDYAEEHQMGRKRLLRLTSALVAFDLVTDGSTDPAYDRARDMTRPIDLENCF